MHRFSNKNNTIEMFMNIRNELKFILFFVKLCIAGFIFSNSNKYQVKFSLTISKRPITAVIFIFHPHDNMQKTSIDFH